MFYFIQVNIGTNIGINIASLLGFAQVIFALFYFIFAIFKLVRMEIRMSSSAKILYIIQLVSIPIFLLLSGIILVFQGWRLDPILQFQQLIISVLIFYLSLKDIVINTVNRNRNR